MDRRKAYKIRHRQQGLCEDCPLPSIDGSHCLKHAALYYQRKRRRVGSQRTYRTKKTVRFQKLLLAA